MTRGVVGVKSVNTDRLDVSETRIVRGRFLYSHSGITARDRELEQ
jgi:hypothetical protein